MVQMNALNLLERNLLKFKTVLITNFCIIYLLIVGHNKYLMLIDIKRCHKITFFHYHQNHDHQTLASVPTRVKMLNHQTLVLTVGFWHQHQNLESYIYTHMVYIISRHLNLSCAKKYELKPIKFKRNWLYRQNQLTVNHSCCTKSI